MASVTTRYAKALADVVFEKRMDVQAAVRDLNSLVTMTVESEDLRKVWENPSIPAEQKRAILDGLVAQPGVARMIRNFIAVLIDNDRIGMIDIIARQFELELDAQLGITEAKVTSSRDLTTDERTALENQIKQVTGKSVRASYATDKGLIGGAVVRIGSTIYDGSVRGQLSRIRETLSAE
jgi:F-type H+-transporting ATPase subunit delta